jgi:hypothetical protein
MTMLGAAPITITRATPGAFVDGYWESGSPETMTVIASVQPLRGRELLALPEAQRVRHPIRIYAEAELHTADQEAGTTADVVTWKGNQYEVATVEDWTDGPLPHWKCTALKLQPAAGLPEPEPEPDEDE